MDLLLALGVVLFLIGAALVARHRRKHEWRCSCGAGMAMEGPMDDWAREWFEDHDGPGHEVTKGRL